MKSFQELIGNKLITEALHPELQEIIKSHGTAGKKQAFHKKISELLKRGESLGTNYNRLGEGSSRVYSPHTSAHHRIFLDGVLTHERTGMKFAKRFGLDKYHDAKAHDGLTLGQMQMRAENGDHFQNQHYRVYRHVGTSKDLFGHTYHHYETNENGIFAPLFEHDDKTHKWAHVGHVYPIVEDPWKEDEKPHPRSFQALTKTKEFPNGIKHQEFHNVLMRDHQRNEGRYREALYSEYEKHMDEVENHPLVQKFLDHQRNFAAPPHDYTERNLGIHIHPLTKKKSIVACDFGYNQEVAKAYRDARQKKRERGSYSGESES